MNAPPDIKELPRQLGELTDDLLNAEARVRRNTRSRFLSPRDGLPSLPVFSRIEVGWRVFMARDGEKVRFLFFRERLPFEVIFETDVTYALTPTDATVRPGPSDPELTRYSLVLPPFLVVRPTDGEFARHAPGAKPKDTLLLRVGPDLGEVLAFEKPRSSSGPIWHTGTGDPQRLLPESGLWPTRPLLALLDSLTDWLEAGPGGESITVPLGHLPQGLPSEIVKRLAAAFHRIGSRAARDPGDGSLLAGFDLSPVAARVSLKLDADGNLADADDKDVFRLAMDVLVTATGADVEAAVTVLPSDFLVRGPLFENFLRVIRRRMFVERAAKLLGIAPILFGNMVEDAATRTIVFRIERRPTSVKTRYRDTNVIALRGFLGGREMVVVLQGEFRVIVEGDRTAVKPELSKLDLVFAGIAEEDRHAVGSRTMSWVRRLAGALMDWKQVLD